MDILLALWFSYMIGYVYSSPQCNVQEVIIGNDSLGHLLSPSLQDPAETPKVCTWKLHVPEGLTLELAFRRFQLRQRNKCEGDFVEILDEKGQKRILCGHQLPTSITFKGTTVITVKSNTVDGSFDIEFHVIKAPCNGEEYLLCRNRVCVPKDQLCNGIDECGDGTDEETCGHHRNEVNNCGRPSVNPDTTGQNRIIGGQEVIPGSWPWQVSVQDARYFPSGHNCGGSLVNNLWVVSAAHCFSNSKPGDVRISLGSHHNFQTEETRKIRYVERIIVHPNFNSLSRGNDIALLKMKAPVAFSAQIAPVCLPSYGAELPLQSKLFATGWGDTRDGSDTDARPLQQVQLPVFEWSKCKSIWQHRLPDNTICTGWRGAPCSGDSGGPLVTYDNEKDAWNLVGIVSWSSYSCGSDGKPTVHTKVSSYLPWIERVISAF